MTSVDCSGIQSGNFWVFFSLKSGLTPGFLLAHRGKNKKGANRSEDGAVVWETVTESGVIGFGAWSCVKGSSFMRVSLNHHKMMAEND